MDEPSARPARGEPRDFRRGIEEKRGRMQWQKVWHFNEQCERYPTRNFVVRNDRPSDDDLCNQCEWALYG